MDISKGYWRMFGEGETGQQRNGNETHLSRNSSFEEYGVVLIDVVKELQYFHSRLEFRH